jgi:hypothetical protein
MRLLKDIVLFLLILSFINDNFIVDKIAGGNSLKIIFGLFIVVHIQEIVKAFKSPKNSVMNAFYFFIFVMFVVLLINTIIGNITLIKGLQVIIAISVVFIYMSYYKDLDKLLYFIWVAVIVSAIVSLFNEPADQWTYRISGGTDDANEFSVHLLTGLSIGIYLFLYKHKNFILFITTTTLFLYALLYAGSKTAMLTLALGVLITIFVKFSFLVRKIFSMKVLLVLIILGVVASQYDFSKMTAVQGLQERAKSFGTAHERFISWKAGSRMIQDNFVLGVGVDNYEKYVRQYALDFIAEGSLAPHNILVKIFAETGFFSFIAFLYFLFVLLYTKFNEILRSKYYWIGLVVFANLLMGLTLSITYEKYFWMSLALLANAIMRISSEEEEEEEMYENTAYIA